MAVIGAMARRCGTLAFWAVGASVEIGAVLAAPGRHLVESDPTALIQHQVNVLSDHRPLHAASSGSEAERSHASGDTQGDYYGGWLCEPEDEGCEFDVPFINGTISTARFHHMAHRSRWIGWKHLSEGHHTNGEPSHKHLSSDVGFSFFTSAPLREWIILAVVCFVLCVLDGLVLRHAPDSFRWHIAVITVWVILAALYMWGVWARMGRQAGIEWISGYVLEWMLSMDNLFIFHLVFQTYKTPQKQIHKAVFIGIIGAVVMRLVFFLVVSTLLHAVGWFRWPFGAMLVWSGIEAVRGEDDDDGDDIKETRLVRFLSWCFGDRILDGYDPDGDSIILWCKKTGKLQLSILFVVIFIVEFSDIIFALDSVSAKVAQIPNQYVAFSSSVLAMYGLRAMFFIIQDLVQMFDLLKYGLGVILVLIGVELMFGHWLHIGSGVECIIIVGIFLVCIAASHIKQRFWPDPEESEEKEGKDEDAEAKDGKEKEDKEEPAGPLADLRERPAGGEVEKGTDKAWTIQEGHRSSGGAEKGEDAGSIPRSQSQPPPGGGSK